MDYATSLFKEHLPYRPHRPSREVVSWCLRVFHRSHPPKRAASTSFSPLERSSVVSVFDVLVVSVFDVLSEMLSVIAPTGTIKALRNMIRARISTVASTAKKVRYPYSPQASREARCSNRVRARHQGPCPLLRLEGCQQEGCQQEQR